MTPKDVTSLPDIRTSKATSPRPGIAKVVHTAMILALAALPALAGSVLPTPLSAQVPAVERLEARPAELSVVVGEPASLTVVALSASGEVVDVPIRVSGERGGVQVRGDEVVGVTPGEYEIVATEVLPQGSDREPAALRIPVRVRWPAVTRIEVTAEEGTLYVGTTLAHRARAFHADGSERPQPTVRWSSSDPSVVEVDAFGNTTGRAPGDAALVAELEGIRAEVPYTVRAFPGEAISLTGATDEVRTGDVVHFDATVLDASGATVEDVPLTWAHTYRSTSYDHQADQAAGQVRDGDFVADLPGLHTVVVTAGPLTARQTFEVAPRDVVRPLEVTGVGRQPDLRTTDFWVFEGVDGRDYVITGSKVADGHAFVFDVTDPSDIVKTDSVQVDARAVNDVKVSPDARYATMTREGASNRRNGVVILDLSDPAHPTIASEVVEGLTGGVHNAYPTDEYVYALSDGDKYLIIDVTDIRAPEVVGEYDHPDSRVHDVWVRDGLAFSAEWETGLVVVDVGNGGWGGTPENPVLVNTLPLPTGRTHAAFPYYQESTGKYYVFVGDEIMSRRGLAWGGYPRSMGSYADQHDPETGRGGIPLTTTGYVQVIDFTDPENPEMVARYEIPEYGTHNIWVEDDVLYQAYYEGGLRVVDVSGELMGDLYTQGREIAAFKSVDPRGYTANSTMVWSAMPHKGYVFFSDTNSGLWAVKLQETERPIS